MRPQTLTVDSVSENVVPIDWRDADQATIAITGVTGTATFDVEQTFQNILAGETPEWLTIAAAQDANGVHIATRHATAIRINATAMTAASFNVVIMSD